MNKYNLTDLQVAKIEAFCADEAMYQAVEKVLLAGIYEHGRVHEDYVGDPLINGAYSLASLALTNPVPAEIVGAQVMAQFAGINAMHNAFNELNSIKTPKPVTKTAEVNEAE
jgi:hypothetical protein